MNASENTAPLTVCAALHIVSGAPNFAAKREPEHHTCGSCHTDGLTYLAADALSKNFASWDAISADGANRWLCPACAWAYKARPGLHHPLLVTTDPSGHTPTPGQLREVLSRPIPPTTSVIVPVSGKRTLAPLAQWGRLTHDGGTISWTKRHARLLNVAYTLRMMGAWERSLTQPSPPMKMMKALPIEQHAHARRLWREFDEARTNDSLCALLLRLSRKDAEP